MIIRPLIIRKNYKIKNAQQAKWSEYIAYQSLFNSGEYQCM